MRTFILKFKKKKIFFADLKEKEIEKIEHNFINVAIVSPPSQFRKKM